MNHKALDAQLSYLRLERFHQLTPLICASVISRPAAYKLASKYMRTAISKSMPNISTVSEQIFLIYSRDSCPDSRHFHSTVVPVRCDGG